MLPDRPRPLAAAILAALLLGGTAHAAPRARNVVLMIVDGAGYNAWAATSMYEGSTGSDFHDREGWVRAAVAPNPGVRRVDRARLADPPRYDPAAAWDTTPAEGGSGDYPYFFEGYRWLRTNRPESASAMTAMVTGKRTYRGAVNVGADGEPIRDTLARIADDSGRSVGIVTSVQLSHATAAAFADAHAPDRDEYCSMAVEMLTSDHLDVIVGCGHPDFDNNGRPIDDPARKLYRFVGGETVWNAVAGLGRLTTSTPVCAGYGDEETRLTDAQIRTLGSWQLKTRRKRIEALVKGKTPPRLLVVPRAGAVGLWTGRTDDPLRPYRGRTGGTLQQQRGSRADTRYTPPGYDPPVETVPSLETLARVALNALDDDPDGFLLQIEGGAVDWAMHDNQLGRVVEEMIAFKRAVEAVVAWVEAGPGWDETLVVVTSDHDHLLWGPDADKVPFDPLRDNGAGKLPGYRWLAGQHSNALVPLYARGAGAEALFRLADREDPVYGRYLDQTEIFEAIRAALEADGS